MKKISLLIAFVAFVSAASYATNVTNLTPISGFSTLELITAETDMAGFAEDGKKLPATQSCTLSAIWVSTSGQKYTITVTATCTDCTVQQACDGAYRVMSIVIPD